MLTTTATAWVGCTAALAAGEWYHRRMTRKVRHRILVSGMRGKSTAVRLLHAGFRAAGCSVLSRITGDNAMHLMPNGSEQPIRRWGPPNIREMRRTARYAAALQCDIVCMENMAIDPEYSRLAGTHILRPTLLLHCIDGTDHTEYYHTDATKRAEIIVDTWPRNVPAIIVDSSRNAAIVETATKKGWHCIETRATESPRLRPFMRELVGAAQDVVAHCTGTDAGSAAIEEAALHRQCFDVYMINQRPVVDLLSANDPESTAEALEMLRAEKQIDDFLLVYMHRSDRPARLVSFAELLDRFPSVITGDVVPRSYRRRRSVPISPGIERVLRDSLKPLVLIGNRHTSQERHINQLFAEADNEKW